MTLKKLKVKPHTNVKVENLEVSDNKLINAVLTDGKKLESEKVLVSIGSPFSSGLVSISLFASTAPTTQCA